MASFKEHRAIAAVALRAKQGKIGVEKLGQRAATLYSHLTERELEELASIGLPEGR